MTIIDTDGSVKSRRSLGLSERSAKEQREPMFDIDSIYRACRYWSEDSKRQIRIVRKHGVAVAVVIPLKDAEDTPDGKNVDVRLTFSTYAKGVKILGDLAVKEAISFAKGNQPEVWKNTIGGFKGCMPKHPAAHLDNPDENSCDVACQMAVFGCLVFG